MIVDESIFQRILEAMTQLEQPTPGAISKATGVSEDHVRRCLKIAEKLGLIERV
jgi:hypothetical protein